MLFQCLLILLFVVFVIFMVMRRPKKLLSLHRKIKVDFPYIPLFGHSYKFIGNNEDRMTLFDSFGRQAYRNKYGAVSFWLGNYLYVSVSDPVSASVILKTFSSKWPLQLFARHLAGNGSVFGDEKIWRVRRKILAPMFATKYYNDFGRVFERNNKILVEKLAAVVGTGDFSMWEYFSSYSLDSAFDMSFGENVNAQRNLNHPFVVAFKDYAKNVAARICQPWLYSEAVYNLLPVGGRQERNKTIIWELVESLILKKKKAIAEERCHGKTNRNNTNVSNIRAKTFLELLIEFSGGEDGYTDTELREETIVLLLAATDSSATAACFAHVLLARHPQVQDKLFNEIQKVLGNSDRSISVDDLINLKYLDAVVKETLRLYPSLPLTLRYCVKDIELPSGLILYEGCVAVLNIWSIHRNPHCWGSDADEFNPDRFLNATPEQLDAFIPFGLGPRNCPGMRLGVASMKLSLAEIIRRYRIIPATTYHYDKQTPLRVLYEIALKHIHDFKIQLQNRC